MSTGLLTRDPNTDAEYEMKADREIKIDRWSDEFEDSTELPVTGAKTISWRHEDPIEDLFAELVSRLSAEGRIDQIRAVKRALREPDWVQVQIRGEGAHRYGYLPAGAARPFSIDPAPVEQDDSWDF